MTEQDFLDQINHADNWRPPALALSDWLEERGDTRATALRLIATDRMETAEEWKTWGAKGALIKKLPRASMPLFAADVAERSLHIYEKKFPNDTKPRMAIAVARGRSENVSLADEIVSTVVGSL